MSPPIPFSMTPEHQTIAAIGGIGALTGLFQLMVAREKVSFWYAVGRAGITAVYAVGALSALVIFPNLVVEAKFGLACAVASLGATGTERLFNAVLDRIRGGSAQ